MKDVLLIIQIILALTLSIFILVQARGTGFGRSYVAGSFTRRGLERIIFRATFIVTALFLIVSVVSLRV